MNIDVLILAAEGISVSHGRSIPACLQPMRGGTSLIDSQVQQFNLCGIPKKSIFIVIGDQGSWNKTTSEILYKKYDRENILVNHKNNTTTSEVSFYLFLEKIKSDNHLLIVNSDSIFDVKHIEQLIHSEENSLLTRSAKSINERGIKIESEGKSVISVIKENVIGSFPWDIYSGLLFLNKSTINFIRKKRKIYDSKGLIYALDKLIDIKNFKKVCYDFMSNGYEFENVMSKDLTGGSFASLSRKHIVRKEAKDQGVEKLIWEIDWLNLLPDNLKPFFPKVIDFFKEENYAWFEMPYYSQNNLRKNILIGNFKSKETLEIIEKILTFCFENLYNKTIDKEPKKTWLFNHHFVRVVERLIQTKSISPKFTKIIKSKYLKINGEKYLNISYILKILFNKSELIKKLSPESLKMIHGDLHFQNILIGPTDTNKDFMLADPRGELLGSDIYYDLGKLWHSFHGLYDLIHTDLFLLEDNIDDLEFTFEFPNKELLNTYLLIKEGMTNLIYKYPLIQNDPYAMLKIRFNECMHFCSVMPFHLKKDDKEIRAIALYIQGVILLNKFYREFNINEFENSENNLYESKFIKYFMELMY